MSFLLATQRIVFFCLTRAFWHYVFFMSLFCLRIFVLIKMRYSDYVEKNNLNKHVLFGDIYLNGVLLFFLKNWTNQTMEQIKSFSSRVHILLRFDKMYSHYLLYTFFDTIYSLIWDLYIKKTCMAIPNVYKRSRLVSIAEI